MTKDQGATVTRLDAIRDAAAKAELTVVERDDGDLLLKAHERDLLADLAALVNGDDGLGRHDDPRRDTVREALEDLGRIRRRSLERAVTADLGDVRDELRRDLTAFMALDVDPIKRIESISDLTAAESLDYARTVRDLVEAYVRLGGDLDLEPFALDHGTAATGVPLYEQGEIWRVISELPGLENATTIADDVVTRLAAAREDGRR